MRKRMFFLFSLILTSLAMAEVTITCQQVGDTNEIQILYDATGDDANRPRAFGLEISVDNGEILSFSGAPVYPTDDNDFWVYPGSIVIAGGSVVNQGTPVVGSLPASSIIVEMASLHSPPEVTSPNAPSSSGVLFSIYVSSDCNVIVDEDPTRGGVVNYDAEPATNNLPVCCSCPPPPDCGCFPSDHPDCEEFKAVGMPDCWCFPRQCHGDADGMAQGKGNYWVFTNDLAILKAAWQQTDSSWPGICADFAHDVQGKGNYRVFTNDLAILKTYWQITGGPEPNCFD